MTDPQYVFRKIRGRVVRIKLTEKQQGASLVAAGAAASIATGALAAELVKRAATTRMEAKSQFRMGSRMFDRAAKPQMAFGFMPGSESTGKNIMRKAALRRAGAAKLFKSRHAILGAGLFASTALVGLGLNKLFDRMKINEVTEAGAETAIHTATAAAGYATYYGRFGAGLAGIGAAIQRARGATVSTNFAIPIKSKWFYKGAKLRF